ncbi:hypothetical protein HPP92_006466 [Vanilla planifolia]|uniref:RING-type domain-containing protein n=1 Tax=Vanilla planifolia TaxID=51239 RepID=A0A835RNX2_VANPL|nr:hypothetical protein HPP92_006466 [Vanilla planifolia]
MEAKTGSDLGTVSCDQAGAEWKDPGWMVSDELAEGHMVCAICLEKILIREMALVKGCEHAYCVTCILRWATYKENPLCPQCKHPFESLNVHRSLDGRIHDCMFEESVCLLLRATWFVPLDVEPQRDAHEEEEDFLYYHYAEQLDAEEEDDDESYFARGFSSVRIGNRRWGDSGYVRAGRREARPVNPRFSDDSEPGPSRRHQKKEASTNDPPPGRRAKRALKREAANKAAAAKQLLQKNGGK